MSAEGKEKTGKKRFPFICGQIMMFIPSPPAPPPPPPQTFLVSVEFAEKRAMK